MVSICGKNLSRGQLVKNYLCPSASICGLISPPMPPKYRPSATREKVLDPNGAAWIWAPLEIAQRFRRPQRRRGDRAPAC